MSKGNAEEAVQMEAAPELTEKPANVTEGLATLETGGKEEKVTD